MMVSSMTSSGGPIRPASRAVGSADEGEWLPLRIAPGASRRLAMAQTQGNCAAEFQPARENAQPSRRPNFLNTIAAGQNPVIEACIMFSPAKAVSKYQ